MFELHNLEPNRDRQRKLVRPQKENILFDIALSFSLLCIIFDKRICIQSAVVVVLMNSMRRYYGLTLELLMASFQNSEVDVYRYSDKKLRDQSAPRNGTFSTGVL